MKKEELRNNYPILWKRLGAFINFKSSKEINHADLYDEFDRNGIYIIVFCELPNIKNNWSYNVHTDASHIVFGKRYLSRNEAESNAFMDAYKMFEKKLNKKS